MQQENMAIKTNGKAITVMFRLIRKVLALHRALRRPLMKSLQSVAKRLKTTKLTHLHSVTIIRGGTQGTQPRSHVVFLLFLKYAS